MGADGDGRRIPFVSMPPRHTLILLARASAQYFIYEVFVKQNVKKENALAQVCWQIVAMIAVIHHLLVPAQKPGQKGQGVV